MNDEKRLTAIAIAAFVLGVALMIPFEATITRVLGVLSMATFIVVGLFAIAQPDRLGAPEDDDGE